MFIALSSPCIQKFSNRHAPFVWLFGFVFFFFLSRSVKTLRHGGRISHTAPVEAQMIHFDHFYHLSGTQEPFRPQKISCFRLGSWKKNPLGIHPKKKPFRSKAFVLLSKFETRWTLALLDILNRTFFVISAALRGLLLFAFHDPGPD